MSAFRVRPNELLAQSEQLDAAGREMSQDMGAIGGVIRQLGTMRGFEEQIEVLRKVQRAGSEQQAKLRQSARTLERAAELYIGAERKNLDGSIVIRTLPHAVKSGYMPAWRVQEMIPAAMELFGTEIVAGK